MKSQQPSLAENIRTRLLAMQDTGYRAFTAKLIPTMDPERIIGVRTPQLRALGKELAKDPQADAFLAALPHQYLEENSLHAFMIAGEKDFDRALQLTEAFLPHIDNWATCDSFSSKVFAKRPEEMLRRVQVWLKSPHPYTQRYAMGVLMSHFLGERFMPEQMQWVVQHRSGEYYVNMMRAWYLSMALVKQWDAALPVLQERRLDKWTHHKAIQKAVESFQVSPERKALLRSLRYK